MAIRINSKTTTRKQRPAGLVWLAALVVLTSLLTMGAKPGQARKADVRAESLDIILLFDLSSSLKTTDRAGLRFRALRDFKSRLLQDDRLAIVGFGRGAKTYLQLTEVGKGKRAIDKAIAKLEKVRQGKTYIGQGIKEVDQLITASKKSLRNPVVVIFTDGLFRPNRDLDIQPSELIPYFNTIHKTILRWTDYKQRHPVFAVHAIAFGKDVARDQLKVMASKGGGQVFEALDGKALIKAFEKIWTSGLRVKWVIPLKCKAPTKVTVTPGTLALQVFVNLEGKKGAKVDYSMVSPDPKTTQKIITSRTKHQFVATVENPTAGVWSVTACGKAKAAITFPYKISLTRPTAGEKIEVGKGIALQGRLIPATTNSAAFQKSFTVSASIIGPGGALATVRLSDDAASPDQTANDGTFSGVFVPKAAGIHKVRLLIRSKLGSISRSFPGTSFIAFKIPPKIHLQLAVSQPSSGQVIPLKKAALVQATLSVVSNKDKLDRAPKLIAKQVTPAGTKPIALTNKLQSAGVYVYSGKLDTSAKGNQSFGIELDASEKKNLACSPATVPFAVGEEEKVQLSLAVQQPTEGAKLRLGQKAVLRAVLKVSSKDAKLSQPPRLVANQETPSGTKGIPLQVQAKGGAYHYQGQLGTLVKGNHQLTIGLGVGQRQLVCASQSVRFTVYVGPPLPQVELKLAIEKPAVDAKLKRGAKSALSVTATPVSKESKLKHPPALVASQKSPKGVKAIALTPTATSNGFRYQGSLDTAQSGKYTISVSLKAGPGPYVAKAQILEITVGKTTAEKKSFPWLWILLGIALLVVVIIVLLATRKGPDALYIEDRLDQRHDFPESFSVTIGKQIFPEDPRMKLTVKPVGEDQYRVTLEPYKSKVRVEYDGNKPEKVGGKFTTVVSLGGLDNEEGEGRFVIHTEREGGAPQHFTLKRIDFGDDGDLEDEQI